MWAGGRASRELIVWGTLAMCGIGLLIARVVGDAPIRRFVHRVGARIESVGAVAWATAMGVVAFGLAFLVQRFIYEGLLTNPDEMISLIQARYLAAGRLGGVLDGDPAAWLILNSLVTDGRWVSQYPPGHLGVLTLGVMVGAPLLVGPVFAGISAGFFTRSLELLAPERVRSVRAASLLLAASPFTALLGGQIMSHSTTMAAGSVALFASLRARNGKGGASVLGWAIAAGAAGALMVAARPWTGLTVGTVLVLGPWLMARDGVRLLS